MLLFVISGLQLTPGSLLKERLNQTALRQIYKLQYHSTIYFNTVTRSFRRLTVMRGDWALSFYFKFCLAIADF